VTVGDSVGLGDGVGVGVGVGDGLGVGGGGGGSSPPIQLSMRGRPAVVHRKLTPYSARTPLRFWGRSLFQSAGHGYGSR
jgi:hypothetical protein